jgi:ABC-2 type transport system permease protein
MSAVAPAPVSATESAIGPVTAAMREVKGPSAVGGDWRRFFALTWVIAKKDYKLSYFGSVLGYLWSLMQPLLFFGVLYLVFAVILDYSKGIKDFPVLLLMNIVLFGFFQASTSGAVTSVVIRESLVRKMHFPRLVIPIATVVTQTISVFFNLIAVLLFMVVYGVAPRWTWLLLPVLVLCLFIFSSGLAMLLSALYVRYRDVAPIWSVIGQALYFASPVFIVINSVLTHGPVATRLYLFNPLAAILQQARHWMIGGAGGGLSPSTLMGSKLWMLVPIGISLGVVLVGALVFARLAPKVAEDL